MKSDHENGMRSSPSLQQPSQDVALLQKLSQDAVAAAEDGEFAAAAATFSKALELAPHDAALHEQLAQCLMELEQHAEALASALTASKLDPTWADAWWTLARCYLNMGQLQAAEQALIQSLALRPGSPDVVAELQEVQQLAVQQLTREVGLPGLSVRSAPAGGRLGPGGVFWEAGVQLAKLLVSSSSCQAAARTPAAPAAAAAVPTAAMHLPIQGSRLLEVGAGTGLVGITAAALGAAVTLTDLPELQPLLRSNISANNQLVADAGGSAEAAVLDWSQLTSKGSSHNTTKLLEQSWDWALGADLVYNSAQVDAVVQLVADFVAASRHGSAAAATAEKQGSTGVDCCQEHYAQQSTVLAPSVGGCSDDGADAGPAGARGFLMAHKHRHHHVDEQLLAALQAAGLKVQVLQQQGLGQQQPRRSSQKEERQGTQQQGWPHICCGCSPELSGISIWWITSSGGSRANLQLTGELLAIQGL